MFIRTAVGRGRARYPAAPAAAGATRGAAPAESERIRGAHAEAEGRQDHEVEDREEHPRLKITDLLSEALPGSPRAS